MNLKRYVERRSVFDMAAASMKTDEQLEALRDAFSTSRIRKGYEVFKGCVLPESFARLQKRIEEFEVYDDDVWVTSFPKCGTTWTQEMVWCIANNLDFEGAKEDLDNRFPFIEYSCVFDVQSCIDKPDFLEDSVAMAQRAKRPRFIKTHLPWQLLPRQIRNFERRPKIIHVTRCPKDTCVSYFYHSMFLEHYTGDFDTFWQLFVTNKLSWTPFAANVLGYWRHRDEPNILILKYEEMKRDLGSNISKVAKFLNKSLTEEEMTILGPHLSFSLMKDNAATKHTNLVNFLRKNNLIVDKNGDFMRCGVSGSHSELMTPEIASVFDEVIEKMLKAEGLSL